MAVNDTFKFGFRRVRKANGGPEDGACHKYYINNGYNTAVYNGDAVVRVAAGSNDTALDTTGGHYPVGSLSEVALAAGTDGSYNTGVIVGFDIIPGDELLHPGRASVHRVVLVSDDPLQEYEIRDDGAAAIGITAVGLNALFAVGTPSEIRRLSGAVLDTDGTAPSADASNPLRIIGVSRSKDVGLNDPTLVNTVWRVMFNNHTEASGALGI